MISAECLHTLGEASAVCHPTHMWRLPVTYAGAETSSEHEREQMVGRLEPDSLGSFLYLDQVVSHLLCWSSSFITKLRKYVCLQAARTACPRTKSRSLLGTLPD